MLRQITLGDVCRRIHFLGLAARDRWIILADDYDFRFGKFLSDDPRRLESVHARHGDIHQHDVRRRL